MAVMEDHQTTTGHPSHSLVAIDPRQPGKTETVVSGHDFYLAPRLSADGQQLAWLCWNQPAMPWDSTELWIAQLDRSGRAVNAHIIAGGPEESVLEPQWLSDGSLLFISDRNGWWNLYHWCPHSGISPVTALHAEFGRPPWQLGLCTYGALNDREILATYTQNGFARLVRVDLVTREMTHITMPFTVISHLRVSQTRAAAIASSETEAAQIILMDPDTGQWQGIRQSVTAPVDPDTIARPVPMAFPTAGSTTAHLFYYPPTNPGFRPPDGERPPLLVFVHGGPTAQTVPAYRLEIQFWTTRGFAVADVNYRGSTGYGRAYRKQLDGQWGIVDVADCIHAAQYLARQGLVDAARLAIRGASAGGYTVLAAAAFHRVFHAGASYYGIGDLTRLAQHTHYFEARYLDTLVGPWPQATALYRARSPRCHAGQVRCPLILFQGLDDRVVLPDQAEQMAAALKENGIPVEYVAFPDEGHGFSRADTIRSAYRAELAFYAKVFGIALPAEE
jgi:dipeptidyl aminopeptidase/acylaminoacyl peptidase